MKAIGLIPARLASTRLPDKPMKDIDGLPMIVHVFKRAELCNELTKVFVATPNQEISDLVKSHGGNPIITGTEHRTGTDRLAEAAGKLDIDFDVVVNIQGDEPLLRPEHISQALRPMNDKNIETVCLAHKSNQVNDINEVKLVFNRNKEIMYFSRSDIPSTLRVKHNEIYKQYCIYSFRKEILELFGKLQHTPLEKIESVELLRLLENGHKIHCEVIEGETWHVDTEEQLERVRQLMKNDDLRKSY